MELAQAKVYPTGPNSYGVSYGDDSQLHVEFYDREVKDVAASEKEGRVIHQTIPYVRQTFPGDRTKVKDEPVDFNGTPGGKPPHPARFPRQWEAYKDGREQVADGTSLMEWPPISRAEAMDLKVMKIHTVEQLANLPDSALTWLGAQMWRNKAKAWLEQATGGSAVLKLQSENESLKLDLEMMKKQIADLAAMKTPDENTGKRKNKTEGDDSGR